MNYPSPNLPRHSLESSSPSYELDPSSPRPMPLHSSTSSAGEASAAMINCLPQQQHLLAQSQDHGIPRPKGAGQAERRATPTVDEIRRAAAAALGKKYLNPSGGAGGATDGGVGMMQILVKQPPPPPEYSLRGNLGSSGSSHHPGSSDAPTTGHPSMISFPPTSSLRGGSNHNNPPVRPSRFPLSDASVARMARSRSLDKYDAVPPSSSTWNDQSTMSGAGSQQSSHDGTATTTTSSPLNISSRNLPHYRLYEGAGIVAPLPPVPPPRAVSSGNYPHHPSTATVTRSASYHFSASLGPYEYGEEPSDAPQSRSQRLLRPYEPRPPMPPPPHNQPPQQQQLLLHPISSHGGNGSSHLQHTQLSLPCVSTHSFESRGASSHNTDSNASFYADRMHGPPSRPPRRRPSLVSPEPSPAAPAPSQQQPQLSHNASSFDGYYTSGNRPPSPPMPASFLVLEDKSVTSGISGGGASQEGGGGGGGGMVEIAPGVLAPLRGSRETWRAIQRDDYRPTTCVVCGCGSAHDTTTLFVIQDASYVLCPICRVVGPVDGDSDDNVSSAGGASSTTSGGGKTGGVGLGFTHEDLVTWISSSSSSSGRGR
jgi:hypothetical protein